MVDYICINEHSSKGDLNISSKVFAKIADEAANRVLEGSVSKKKEFNIDAPTEVSFSKDGKVSIKITIILKKGINPKSICTTIQEEIAKDLAIYTESIPFEIEIEIADIK